MEKALKDVLAYLDIMADRPDLQWPRPVRKDMYTALRKVKQYAAHLVCTQPHAHAQTLSEYTQSYYILNQRVSLLIPAVPRRVVSNAGRA